MPDGNDQNDQHAILHRIDDSVVAGSNPVKIGLTRQLLRSVRSWIGCQRLDLAGESLPGGLIEFSKGTSRGGCDLNLKPAARQVLPGRVQESSRPVKSVGKAKILFQLIPLYARGFFLQCGACRFEVNPVLQIFQQSKILNRDNRRDILPVSVEQNALTAERDFVDDVGELEARFTGGNSGH